MKLGRGIATNGTGGVMLEGRGDKLTCRLRRMDIADASLCVPLQLLQRNANTFAMRFTHATIAAYKGSQRNGFRRGERRIPSCAMFRTGDLLAVLILVSSGGLMPDELGIALGMPTFAQA